MVIIEGLCIYIQLIGTLPVFDDCFGYSMRESLSIVVIAIELSIQIICKNESMNEKDYFDGILM